MWRICLWILGLKGLNFEITSCQHPKSMVSLLNRRVGRRGRQSSFVWQMWQGYYLHVLSWSWLNTNVFYSFTKDLLKGNWSLVKSCFKPNLCHTYRRRFAVFFPLPSCCISSLMWIMFLFKYHCVKFWCRYIVYNNSMTGHWLCR